MKLALFGRTRGRGTKVKDWPDVQFIVANKQSAPVAVIVVKSRLLDVMKSLETTPEENLRMAYETIACLQDNGLEVIVDLEHAMDAACGRRENGLLCDGDVSKRTLDYFHEVVEQCAGQKVSRLVVCDTTGGANPEEVTQVIGSLTQKVPSSQDRISRPYRSRSWSCQFPSRRSCRGQPGSRHSSWNWRALRQREPDHRDRQHAAPGRS